MIVAFTGHRPEDCEDESVVRARVRAVLTAEPIVRVITGCAAGFDLWAGDEALALGIPLVAARPWATHGPRKKDVALYAKIIEGACEVVNVVESSTYSGPWCYHKRNEWMVDNATHVLAYWSGKQSGGTYACVKYARKVEKPIRNCYG